MKTIIKMETERAPEGSGRSGMKEKLNLLCVCAAGYLAMAGVLTVVLSL